MKKLIITICLIYFIALNVCLIAQLHYKAAVIAAENCEGTDSAIEETMYSYGFDIDAMDTQEPSMDAKIIALFN